MQKSKPVQAVSMSVANPPVIADAFSARLWFAVYTACRHEKKVSQHLTLREIEHYLPLYRSERKWRDGSRVTLDLPLFPGYLFVRICRSERGNVLGVPGALTMVDGAGGTPAQVPDGAVDALRKGLIERQVEPHQLLTVGQMARIRAGAFAGMEGVVVRRRNGLRVVLTMKQILQSIAVEVNEVDLEPMNEVGSLLPHLAASLPDAWQQSA